MKILIESNERGKRAQRVNRVLREENKILMENNALYRDAVRSKDSTIADRTAQVHSLMVGNAEIMGVVHNKDMEIRDVNARLQKSLSKIERNRKARPWIIGGSAAFGAAAVKWGPQVIKMIFKR